MLETEAFNDAYTTCFWLDLGSWSIFSMQLFYIVRAQGVDKKMTD
jgi:hypothetical protein